MKHTGFAGLALALSLALGGCADGKNADANAPREQASDDQTKSKSKSKNTEQASRGDDEEEQEGSDGSEPVTCPDFQQRMSATLQQQFSAPIIGSVTVSGPIGLVIARQGMTLTLDFDTSGINIKPALARSQATKLLNNKLSKRTFELVAPNEVDHPALAKAGCALLLAKNVHSETNSEGVTYDPAAPVVLSPKADDGDLADAIGSGKTFDGIKATNANGSQDGSVQVSASGSDYAFDFQFGGVGAAMLPNFGFTLDGQGGFASAKASLTIQNSPMTIEFR